MLWEPQSDKSLQARLMVYAHMQEARHRVMKAVALFGDVMCLGRFDVPGQVWKLI